MPFSEKSFINRLSNSFQLRNRNRQMRNIYANEKILLNEKPGNSGELEETEKSKEKQTNNTQSLFLFLLLKQLKSFHHKIDDV
jgi:hypothetical protein